MLRRSRRSSRKASDKYADVTFGKIDTEAQQELAGAAGIQAIPTLMLFRDGVLLFRESGALPAAALDQLVTQAKGLDMAKVKAEMEKHAARASSTGRAAITTTAIRMITATITATIMAIRTITITVITSTSLSYTCT